MIWLDTTINGRPQYQNLDPEIRFFWMPVTFRLVVPYRNWHTSIWGLSLSLRK